MNTDPQSPQGSPSEARGSQSPSHPVAEGRQSPGPSEPLRLGKIGDTSRALPAGLSLAAPVPAGLEEFEEAVRAEVDAGYMHSVTSPEYLAAKSRLDAARASLSAPGAPQGGSDLRAACLDVWREFEYWNSPMMAVEPIEVKWDRYYQAMQRMRSLAEAATPSQEEGPAGLDAEKLIDAFGKAIVAYNSKVYRNEADPKHREDTRWEWEALMRARGTLLDRLRAQAPASSPRDLEAKLDRLCESVKHWAQNGMTADLLEVVEWNRASILSAHPPKGETPSEAAVPPNGREITARAYDCEHDNIWSVEILVWKNEKDARGYVLQEDGFSKSFAEKIAHLINRRDPAPGTPIENAAREGALALLREFAATESTKDLHPRAISQKEEAELVIERFEDWLSSLPQEGAAGEGEPLPSVGGAARLPPEGYRLLLPDERVKVGDMIDCDDGEIRPATAVGYMVKSLLDGVRYIRPLPARSAPERSEGPNTSNTNATQEGAQEPKEGGDRVD